MRTSPSPCVPDTSVLLDFWHSGILETLFSLPYRWLLPDLMLSELRLPEALRLFRGEVVAFSGQEISAMLVLRATYRGLSLADCAVLFLAQRERALLLTGDRTLRQVAVQHFHLNVHGTLWLLDRLVEAKLLSGIAAATALRAMLAGGSRLPRDECERRLRLWDM